MASSKWSIREKLKKEEKKLNKRKEYIESPFLESDGDIGSVLATKANQILENSMTKVTDYDTGKEWTEYDLSEKDAADLSIIYNYWYEEYCGLLEEFDSDENTICILLNILEKYGIDWEKEV